MKKTIFNLSIIALIVAILAIALYNMASMNYTILAILFAGMVLFVKHWKHVSEIVLAIAVLLICMTLKNYFQGVGEVYSNSDHHAVRVDGYIINQPIGYQLAANNENALLDNEKYNGSLSVQDFDAEGVTLKLTGFTQSLYAETYNGHKLDSSQLLNAQSMIAFDYNDTVAFVSKNGSEYKLRIDYLDKEEDVECLYVLKTATTTDTLSEKRVIKKGLALNSVMGDTYEQGLSLGGINFIRAKTRTGHVDIDSCKKGEMIIELDNRAFGPDATIKAVKVLKANSEVATYALADLGRKSISVKVKYGQEFSIGCLGELKSSPMRFLQNGDSLKLEYVTPKYHYLSSLNKKGSNVIFVTTSLNSEVISERYIPENIMAFDLFENENNKNIFSPFYLSYSSGSTTQELLFEINSSTQIKAGEKIPNLKSANGKIEWIAQVEDFKATSKHMQENNIIIFIILLGVVCITGVLWYRVRYGKLVGFVGRTNLINGRVEYYVGAMGAIEIVSYLAVLLLFSFRMLLMWRASVFPPVVHTTIYEFNHVFRNEDVLYYQFGALNSFFVVLFGLKMFGRAFEQGWTGFWGQFVRPILPGIICWVVLTIAEIWLFNLDIWPVNKMTTSIFYLLPIIALAISKLCMPIISNVENIKAKSFSIVIKGVSWVTIPVIFIVLAIIFGVSITVAMGASNAVGKILVPIVGYLLIETIIWKSFNLDPQEARGAYSLKSNNYGNFVESRIGWAELFGRGLGWSVLNGLLYTGVLTKIDGGYAIIFLAFVLFGTILKLYDFYRSYFKPETSRQPRLKLLSILLLAVLCALLFVFFKEILSWIYLSKYWVCIPVVSIGLAIILVLLGYAISFNPFARINGAIGTIVAIIVSSVVLSVALNFMFKEFLLVNHTAQRVIVQTFSPEEGLAQTKSASDERRFFEASVNDYILNVYNQQGEDVSFIGKGGKEYFKIQQHSKVGALFGAQASDILPARFIISEHGTWLYVIFMIMYMIMLYHGIIVQTRYRVSKMLLMQIPCLLLIHSLFVWMANTQLFIFLGQDVPLFSLHSKLSILLYFVLTTIWVAVAICDRYPTSVFAPLCSFRKHDYDGEKSVLRRFPYNSLVARVFVIFILGGMCGLFAIRYSAQGEDYYIDRTYSLENFLKHTGERIAKVNELFEQFQNDLSKNTQLVEDINDVSLLINAFEQKHKSEIKELLGGDGYVYRIWERFAQKGGAKQNESSALLHVRKIRDTYYLAVRKKFYNQELPSVNDNEWKGSIVASADQNTGVKVVDKNNGLKQYILPKHWLNSNEEVALLVNESNSLINIESGDASRSSFEMASSGYTMACRRFNKDYNIALNKLQSLASSTFYARSVVINGRRDFVYPMSEKFFWAYSFANEVRNQKNNAARKIKQHEKLPNDFHADIPITIDKTLTKELKDCLSDAMTDSRTYASVIVADGDGQIRAMVDNRRGEYSRLNPNDRKRMAEISDEMYMNLIYQIDNAYFGNINLMEIPGGPGSSQKPIVWTAVASGIDYDWKNLKITKFKEEYPIIDGKYYSIRHFNSERMYPDKSKTTFTALKWPDENNGNGVSLKEYMDHSSNYYNALMLYIGSFSNHDMRIAATKDNTTVFAKLERGTLNNVDKYAEAFPILESNGVKFRLNKSLSRDYENSLLFNRLHSMFGFNRGAKLNSLYPSLSLDTIRVNLKSGIGYAFSKGSTFKYVLDDNSDRAFNRTAIHQTAVGGSAAWQVTPLFMAQCFGRLVMLKSNYNLTVEPARNKGEYIPFGDLSDGFKEARSTFLDGMNNLQTLGVFNSIKAVLNDVDGKSYYVYGKTGTSNEPESELPLLKTYGYGKKNLSRDLHRLALVITSDTLSGKSVEDLKEVKFYTVYFTTRYNLGQSYKTVVEKIVNSGTFKKYMEEKND